MSPRDGAGGGVGGSIKVSPWPSLIAQVGKGKNMTISAISRYRGGTIDEVFIERKARSTRDKSL
jgi:hypothetical protein